MPSFEPGRPQVTSRYECKYLVPRERLPQVRASIEPFVRPDRFAAGLPEHRYPICSLYLDSADLLLFRMTDDGARNRYKLRIRCYSDDPSAPIFFEIKRRCDGIVRKWRRSVPRDVAERYLGGRGAPDAGIGEFLHLVREIDAGPTFRVRYEREAYEVLGEPTRITFDTDLAYNPTLDENVSLNGPGWQFPLPHLAIIEIKFTDRFPTWVQDVVHIHELRRSSVPKYCISVEEALGRGICHLPVFGHRSLASCF